MRHCFLNFDFGVVLSPCFQMIDLQCAKQLVKPYVTITALWHYPLEKHLAVRLKVTSVKTYSQPLVRQDVQDTVVLDQMYDGSRKHVDKGRALELQSTLVISNSKGLSEILRDIRSSTYQVCRIEEKIIWLTTFNKLIGKWTFEVRDILKILWKRGEIAP